MKIYVKTSPVTGLRIFLLAVTAAASFGTCFNVNGAPLLSYNFNEPSGDTAINAGSLGGGSDLTMRGSNGTPADLHGGSGSGVSGLPGDLAFVNTTGQANASSVAGMNELQSLTVAGWFKTATDDPIDYLAKIFFNNQLIPSAGFEMSFNGTGDGRLRVDIFDETGAYASLASDNVYSAKQEWVFFAVTWDMSTSAISFYVGTPNSSVQSAGSSTVTTIGPTGINTGSFALGNLGDWAGTYPRPFDGSLDNVALWGSQTDGSGALSQGDLEVFRMSAIPEPGIAGMAVMGGALLVALRRMRRAV